MAVPAIFLDRDGVIIENRADYIRTWSHVTYIQPAFEALISLSQLPYPIIIVTNQSAVGRKLISKAVADEINQRLVLEIRQAGGRIDGVYMCPHAPEANCSCRKPKPGLLLQAAEELNLDLARSIMVGDALTDIHAGRKAGVGQAVMVLTGRGKDQLALPETAELEPLHVYPNLKFVFEDLSNLALPLL